MFFEVDMNRELYLIHENENEIVLKESVDREAEIKSYKNDNDDWMTVQIFPMFLAMDQNSNCKFLILTTVIQVDKYCNFSNTLD